MKKLLVVLLVGYCFFFSNFCQAQSFAGLMFDSLSKGMPENSAVVLALAMKDSTNSSHLYAGGNFKIAGRDSATNIAEWNDSLEFSPSIGKWKPLGSGVNNTVCALAMYDKKLYAGGKFDTAGGIAASHIASWDTTTLKWDSLLGTLNGNVYALCVYNNSLYVGGDFTIADGDTVNRIAMWNGTAWSAVGKGFDSTVYALVVNNDTLYAGGAFVTSNGRILNHVAKWSGTFWDSVGAGTNNTVYALGSWNQTLFVGGAFTQSGGIPTNYISVYDNTKFPVKWDSLGSGVNDTVRVINAGDGIVGLIIKKNVGQQFSNGNVLLVGGNFTKAGGYSSRYIAGWFYDSWDTIGQLNGPVYALANLYNFFSGVNFVGGEFDSTQQNLAVNHVAYMSIFLGGGIATINNNSDIAIYPNPSNGVFTMEVKSEELKMKNIEVYNVLGEQVYSIPLNLPQAGDFEINLSNQPNGVYFYRVVDENSNLIGEGKLVIQK